MIREVTIMTQLIIKYHDAMILGSLLTLAFLLLIRPIAVKAFFVDTPTKRKIHKDQIPLSGGISIFLATVLTLLISLEIFSSDLVALVFCAGLMLILGIVDDKFDLPALTKLFGQTAISLLFVIESGYVITDLGALFGLSSPLELGLFSVPLTVVTIVGLTNAINMIDGCDGLASSLVIIALISVSVFGAVGLNHPTTVLLLIVIFSLVVFLFFNFSHSKNFKIFLGDGGSLFLGFIVGAKFVEFTRLHSHPDPSMVLWIIAVPILDFSAVILMRLLLGRGIMVADRSHIHHLLLSWGFSHFQTTALISAAAVALLLVGAFISSNFPSLSFLSFLALFILYVSARVLAYKAD